MMDNTSYAVKILKSRLQELEENSKNAKEEIERLYKETITKAVADRLQSLSQFKNEDKEKSDILNALKALGESIIINEREIPENYSSKLNFVEKTLFALGAINSGDFEDVKTKLLKLEPNISPKSLQDINQCLSGLYKKGHIKALRNGRRYIYSIR